MIEVVGDEPLRPSIRIELVVEQAHVGLLQVRLVGGRRAPQQTRIFPGLAPGGIDVEFHDGTGTHPLRLGQCGQVGHPHVQDEYAARTHQPKRRGPGAPPVVECDQVRHRTARDDHGVEAVVGARPVAHVAFDQRHPLADRRLGGVAHDRRLTEHVDRRVHPHDGGLGQCGGQREGHPA